MNVISQTSEEAYNEMLEVFAANIGKVLYPGDERMIFGKTMVLCKSQEYSALNAAARQTWLDYAYGPYLDAIGARYDVKRTDATRAETVLDFYIDNGVWEGSGLTVSSGAVVCQEVNEQPDVSSVEVSDGSVTETPVYDPLTKTLTVSGLTTSAETVNVRFYYAYGSDIEIPIGTQVTGDSVRFFETLDTAVIPKGERHAKVNGEVGVNAEAVEAGAEYNDIQIGEINTVVDLYNVPLVPDVSNISVTSGGDDAQSDPVFREVVRIASNKTTTAGPRDSYRYHIIHSDPSILDAIAVSPQNTNVTDFPDMKDYSPNYVEGMTGTPGEVFCYAVLEPEKGFLVTDGSNAMSNIKDALEKVRPLTDLVHVLPTRYKGFTVTVTAYLAPKDAGKESDVRQAVSDYILWQQTAFGRDINPDNLRGRLFEAGAQRFDVTAPSDYVEIEEWEVAHCTDDPIVNVVILKDDGEVYDAPN